MLNIAWCHDKVPEKCDVIEINSDLVKLIKIRLLDKEIVLGVPKYSVDRHTKRGKKKWHWTSRIFR